MEKKDFPEILYVSKDEMGDEEWWAAEDSPHNLANPQIPKRAVGIYRLVGMGEVITGVTFEQSDT